MNEDKTRADAERRAGSGEPADPPETDGEVRAETPWSGPAAADEMVRLAAEKAELEAARDDLTERLVRLAAEMDNLRKRTERDMADAQRYAVTKFAADMLVVADNLKRTLEAVPAERRAAGDDVLAALVEGVEMTDREMHRLLERHGVRAIAALGERFDPHRHQAMYEVPDADAAPGTVVQVVQEGYQIGERVLRAALVGVAKEAPAEPRPETPDDRESGGT